MTKQQLHKLWAEVELELRTLRPLFDSSPEGVMALGYFDEYLSHNELGLALDTLCDFLVASDESTISSGQLDQIQALHSKMGMEDEWFESLRQKATS